MKSIISILILTLSGTFASAQSVFEVDLKNISTDQTVSLSDFKSSKGIAVVFMSAKCPYAKYYEQRLQKMIKDYRDKGITFLMVNANSSEPNDLMKSQAKTLNAKYLLDSSRQLASLLGAKKSPEVFLLKGDGTKYYMGAIDDNPQVATDVKVNYLKGAIDALLAGKSKPVNSGRPVGCMIK